MSQLPVPLEILSEEIAGLLITVQIDEGKRRKFWMIKEDIFESDVYRNWVLQTEVSSIVDSNNL